jgi:hypothetical protein
MTVAWYDPRMDVLSPSGFAGLRVARAARIARAATTTPKSKTAKITA